MVISQFDHRSLVISICGGGSDCICDWPAIVFLVPPSIIFPGGAGGGRPRGRCEVIDVLLILRLLLIFPPPPPHRHVVYGRTGREGRGAP